MPHYQREAGARRLHGPCPFVCGDNAIEIDNLGRNQWASSNEAGQTAVAAWVVEGGVCRLVWLPRSGGNGSLAGAERDPGAQRASRQLGACCREYRVASVGRIPPASTASSAWSRRCSLSVSSRLGMQTISPSSNPSMPAWTICSGSSLGMCDMSMFCRVWNSVFTTPGQTTCSLTPLSRTYFECEEADQGEQKSLVAVYTARRGSWGLSAVGLKTSCVAMLTSVPCPRSTIPGSAAWIKQSGASTFRFTSSCAFSAGISRNGM